MPSRPRLCVVTTSPIVVRYFLIPHLRLLADTFDVTLVANGDCRSFLADLKLPPRMEVTPIERQIHPWHDPAALAMLYRLFRKERFDAVFSVAPKAGLLAMTAAAAAKVPYRCHVFQGEVWASRKGAMRRLLREADGVTARAASESIVVSPAEREFLIGEGILRADRSLVLGAGSICGVDTKKFAPNPEARARIRASAGIPQDARLLLFLGRLKRDKGVIDLVAAWKALAGEFPDLCLAVVGPDEDGLIPVIRALAGRDLAARLNIAPESKEPEAWIAAADILGLPSYREGFGNVIIEAGATEVPVVASRIYGTESALIENVTGLAHPPGDREALQSCLRRLVEDGGLRQRLGKAGRALVSKNSSRNRWSGATWIILPCAARW